jgi:predicted CXXCH cytochrome family protein
MPRTTLILLFIVIMTAVQGSAQGLDQHLDTRVVPGGCASCHKSHGISGSPMLPESQAGVCLRCHDNQASLDALIAQGIVSPDARPTLMSVTLNSPSVHPLTDKATTRHSPGSVTCTSCHLPHRSLVETGRTPGAPEFSGARKPSLRNPTKFEYQLCGECHGTGDRVQESQENIIDNNRLLSATNRSFHPVEAPARERSQSVRQNLSGKLLNCTDCHGNSDPNGPRGPHGSSVPYLLRHNYTTGDGADESESTYALCYRCHNRQEVLNSSIFPEHGLHIVELKASCASCHSAHGSVANRSLVRFGEETLIGSVSASMAMDRLEFVSDAPGSGACFLTCHGEDHDPAAYGSMKLRIEEIRNSPASRETAAGIEWVRRPAARRPLRADELPPPRKPSKVPRRIEEQ